VSTWLCWGSGAPTIGNQLSVEQTGQLSDLLVKFETVMSGMCVSITSGSRVMFQSISNLIGYHTQ